MADRDMRPEAREQWSQRNQTLRHSGVKREDDDEALLEDPKDYSAVGGPESEQHFGNIRSDNGHFPFDANGGAYDRDNRPEQMERGGYDKLDAESGLDRVHVREESPGDKPV